MIRIAVDFGSTRIKVARWDAERGESVLLSIGRDGKSFLPAVFFLTQDGRVLFGEEAERFAFHDPLGVIDQVKMALGQATQRSGHGGAVATPKVLGCVLERIRAWCFKQFPAGSRDLLLVLTIPRQQEHRAVYEAAAGVAGFSTDLDTLRLVSEATALERAAVRELQLPDGTLVAMLDIGGGMSSWAAFRTGESGQKTGFDSVASGGVKHGGGTVDRLIFDWLMERLPETDRQFAGQNRIMVLDQIRAIKEGSIGGLCPCDHSQDWTIPLGEQSYRLEEAEIEQIGRRAGGDAIASGFARFVTTLLETQHSPALTCILTGGGSMFPPHRNLVEARLRELSQTHGCEITCRRMANPGFALVQAAVVPTSRAPAIEANLPKTETARRSGLVVKPLI